MSMLHILTIAALDWRNGHEYALQAMAEIQRGNIDFEYHLVGDGPFLEAVAFARHDLGLERAVQLISKKSARTEGFYSRWADVYLLAAVADGAWAGYHQPEVWGKPILCTDLPGLAEQFSQNHPIYVVQRRDPAALADILSTLSKRSTPTA